MDKRVTARVTSSPAEQDSSSASMKNDSFLEDMELFSHDTKICIPNKEAERHVTRKTMSPAIPSFAAVIEEQDNLFEQKTSQNSTCLKLSSSRRSGRREISSTERLQTADGNFQTSVASKDLRVKTQESKSRSQDNKLKSKPGESKTAECQTRLQSEPNKLQQEKKPLAKDRGRRSGSCKDTDQSGEAFKENKQPLNLPKQGNASLETSKDHPRKSDGGKKIDSREIPESVALLSAVKEVVSTYTKEEGMKILRTLNELHILSQASLIKNLMCATDEIRKDLQLGKNLEQLKVLMAENEQLRENFALLKIKNEDLRRKLEETESIKEENARLKIKLHELTGRNPSC